MMDWIHCNLCFLQPSAGSPSTRISLHLTSCGHMYCKDCLDEGIKDDRCKICKNNCSNIKLSNDMKPEIKDFFSEPEQVLTKMSKLIDFQKQHRVKLTAHRVALEHKYKEAKKEIIRLSQLTESMYSDIKKLRQENQLLKNRLLTNTNNFSGENTPFKVPNIQLPLRLNSSQSTSSKKSYGNKSKFQIFNSTSVTPHRVRHNNEYFGTGSNLVKGLSTLLTPTSMYSTTPGSK